MGRLVRRSKTVLYRSSKHNFVMHLTMNENDCIEYIYVGDINGYENLECEIKKHIPQFDVDSLIPMWKTDAPI